MRASRASRGWSILAINWGLNFEESLAEALEVVVEVPDRSALGGVLRVRLSFATVPIALKPVTERHHMELIL